MRATAAITYGVLGQTLAYRALQGQPSSATFKVLRDYQVDEGTVEFSGTCTVEAVLSTIDATSGVGQADPQKITLETDNIVVGRKYLLTEAQKSEWVEPVEVTATYIRCRHPLASSYTTSAVLKGTTITAAVDATWVVTLAKVSDTTDPSPDYRVRWDYTVGGLAYAAYSFFDLVREAVAHSVDIDDVNARAPGLRDKLPKEYQVENGRPLVEAAWRAIRADFVTAKLDINAMRDDEGLDELVILRSLLVLAEGGWHPTAIDSGAYIALTATNYDRFLEKNYSVVLSRATAQDNWNNVNAPASPRSFWAK